MQSILNQKKNLFIIVEKGIFYYPAYKHYGHGLHGLNVCCDFCSKSNLDCCVGFENKDLCLRCVELFVENNKKNNNDNNKPLMTNLYQQTNPHIITRMMQNSVRRNPSHDISTTTYMMQDSVRRNYLQQYNDDMTFMMQDSVRSSEQDEMLTEEEVEDLLRNNR